MGTDVKRNLAHQISKYLDSGISKISRSSIKISRNKKNDRVSYRLIVNDSKALSAIKNNSASLKCINNIEDIEISPVKDHHHVDFYMEPVSFVKNTIYGVLNPSIPDKPSKKIIIEYSSPNIAKPFHVGHLRSTIIGNFLSNINTYYGENVTRLNYLGDWGTQFGLLKAGIDLCNLTQDDIKMNPMENLYKAYVTANKKAETDDTISSIARQTFTELENGTSTAVEEWNMYRELTMRELNITYNRLGTSFDEYNWESMYSSNVIRPMMNDLESMGIIKSDEDGKKIAVVNNRNVTVIKSDGSSLYLSRDIAAAHDRFTRYNFDEMLYIVDSSQSDHFKAILGIMDQMKSPIADRCKHVKFGRINGMSTRKGTTVFLHDILNEAKDRMNKKQAETKTTKAALDDDATTDTLGITAVIINDLKQRREKNYDFSWDKALQNHGDSGIKLQYLHCRLYSIERNSGLEVPAECRPELIQEPEALHVIQELARFDDVLEESCRQMEACLLIAYLFNLSNVINKAINTLNVKNQPKEIGEQRLLLFHTTRLVVKKSLEILGVRPLNQM